MNVTLSLNLQWEFEGYLKGTTAFECGSKVRLNRMLFVTNEVLHIDLFYLPCLCFISIA